MMKPIGFVVLAACAASFRLCAEDAIVTNTWQGASGGSWSAAANWSQGHAPKSWEYVLVPDQGDMEISLDAADCVCGCFALAPRNAGSQTTTTLSGSGTLVVSGYVGTEANPKASNISCSLPSWRLKFVVDGPNVTFNGGKTLFTYAPIEVRGGASFTVNSTVRLWKNQASLLVDDASVVLSYLSYNEASGQFVKLTNGAKLTLPNIAPDATTAIAIDISGGSTLDVGAGTMMLVDGSTITLTDTSVLRCKTWPTYS